MVKKYSKEQLFKGMEARLVRLRDRAYDKNKIVYDKKLKEFEKALKKTEELKKIKLIKSQIAKLKKPVKAVVRQSKRGIKSRGQ